jgi:hypothetical protein
MERHGEVKRRKGALSDDDRMHELDGNMLRVRSVWAAAEGQKASTSQKALGHLAAGFRQLPCLPSEELLDNLIAHEQEHFNLRSQFASRL